MPSPADPPLAPPPQGGAPLPAAAAPTSAPGTAPAGTAPPLPAPGQPPAETGKLRDQLRSGKLEADYEGVRDLSIYYFDRSTTYPPPQAESGAPARPALQRIGDLLLTAVPGRELAQVRATFLAPTVYREAQRRFRERGLLVLRGPAGSGRRAAALHLLGQVSYAGAAEAAVYELNPGVRLVDLDPAAIPPHTSLLLDAGDGRPLLGLSDFHLKQLSSHLVEGTQDNGLIVLVEQLPPGLAAGLGELVLDWRLEWEGSQAETQRDLVHRHLRYLASQEPSTGADLEARIEALLAEPEPAALFQQSMTPAEAVELAGLLLPVLKREETMADALEKRRARVDESVRRWFLEGGHDAETTALLIAASVFNGTATEEIEEAAQALLDRLLPAPDPAAPAPPAVPENPFSAGLRRTQRWATIQAEAVRESHHDDRYGSTTVLVRRLRNESWPKAVLSFVWTQMSTLRDGLLDWLAHYAVDGSSSQRPRAAAAVGALAIQSFPQIEARLIRPWARSTDPDARRAAARALAMTLWDDSLAAASARLVRSWVETGDRELCWTAAITQGMAGAGRDLAPAIADLRQVARLCVQEPWLFSAVSGAFWMLYADAKEAPATRLALLEALVGWCSETRPQPRSEQDAHFALRRTALLCFLWLLMPAEADPVWRLLLADCATPAPLQQAAVTLLRAALNFRQPQGSVRDDLHPRLMARDLLHDLLETVADPAERTGQDALDALLRALVAACAAADASAGGHDECERLRFLAEGWEKLPAGAQGLRELLLQQAAA